MMIKKCLVVFLAVYMILLSSCHASSSSLASTTDLTLDVEQVTNALYEVMESISNETEMYFWEQAQYTILDINNDGKNELIWLCVVNGLTLLDIKIYVFYFDGSYDIIDNERWLTKSYDDLKSISVYQENKETRIIIESKTFSSGELRKCFRVFNEKFDLLDMFYSIEAGDTCTLYHNEEMVDGDLYRMFNSYIANYQLITQATLHTIEDYMEDRNKIMDILSS